RRRDGSSFPVEVSARRIELDGRCFHQAIIRDISERKQAEVAIRSGEAQLRLYANVYEHSGEGILICDHNNRILAVNPAFTRLTGYSIDELRGKNPHILASGNTPPKTYQDMWRSLGQKGYWQGELWNRRKDGNIFPEWLSVSVASDLAGQPTHYIACFTDISERKASEDHITHLAHHDALTGLLNRYSLQGRLEQALATIRREQRALAVMFIDMDHFKNINDILGHAVGDELLMEVARRLRDGVRDSDVVARLGGDEFVLVLTEVDNATAAARVADKILRALGEPYAIGEEELHVTPSIGLAFYPDDGDDCETLMKHADIAMYHAKSQGRNNVQFFTAEMNQAAVERLSLDHDLRVALEERQFELHYQPQLDASSGSVVGVEALVRWRHPRDGLVSPLKFIPVAEETGLIIPLGEWVLNEACRQLRAWRQEGLNGVTMAVNLSAHQLRSPTLLAYVTQTLERHGLTGIDLELEVTESVAMANPDASIGQLQNLRDLGVRLSIDDFGTGYSSLNYLKRLPIHTLKLDRSFVNDIETDANDVAICTATIALAHNLGLRVVAEGVENAAQHNFLATLRCDTLQGYLFSRPIPALAALAYIQENQLTHGQNVSDLVALH
ncbi:MAG: EAL domain-containing protein, partial [Sterolibacterium sp.]